MRIISLAETQATGYRLHGHDSQVGSVRVVIYPGDREHMPPHVHVFSGDGEVKIAIGDVETAPSVMLVLRMRKPDVRAALRIVEEHQEACLRAWRRYHGW